MSQPPPNDMDVSSKGDMMVNNLIYRQPKALSLAKNRTLRRQKFQLGTYSDSQTSTIVLNTGSDYVKTSSSYLTFNMLLTGTTPTANFANGSAVNIIEDISIRTRSGTEVDRIERVNLWSKNDVRNTFSQDWFDNYGTMAGFGATGIGGTDAAILSDTDVRFVIPLNLISGFFRPVGGQLMPPQLAAGMEIQISFADYRTALFQKAGTVTGYTISDISIMCDCVTLADDVQKTLNMESASSGLEYTYPRFHTASSTVTSTSVNVQVQKSVAQASTMTACLLTKANVLDVTVDSLKSETWDVSSWQYRIGSLYYPNEKLLSATNGLESFFIAQSTYDKPKHGYMENAVSLTDFVTNGYGIMSASFERDQALNLSGVPINNSRQAELNATLASWSANIECVVFLEYVAVARAFIDNCVIAV